MAGAWTVPNRECRANQYKVIPARGIRSWRVYWCGFEVCSDRLLFHAFRYRRPRQVAYP